MNQQCAYVYKWTHLPSLRWYVGSRTAKNAHLNDGYICSSKLVLPLIKNNPTDWEKTIVATGLAKDMRKLESDILSTFDAAKDSRSFNRNNQDGSFCCFGHSLETKEKMRKAIPWAGKSRPDHAEKMLGKKRKAEDIQKWAQAMRGKPKTESHKKSLKIAKIAGTYVTPCGQYTSSRDAAQANNCSKSNVLQKCNGFFARGIWYPPKQGWKFISKECK